MLVGKVGGGNRHRGSVTTLRARTALEKKRGEKGPHWDWRGGEGDQNSKGAKVLKKE